MSSRKEDHIELALKSETSPASLDLRFDYDPVHGSHPKKDELWPASIAGKSMNYPVWVSSMTGGANKAKQININLAKLCAQFKLGMGLGSCRKIIEDPSCIPDFQVRKYLCDQALFANIGIAQCAEWEKSDKLNNILEIINICEADGLTIHLNPMQEWLQSEGDHISEAPIHVIRRIKDKFQFPIIVKEVGQGISMKGLHALMQLDLEAIEFGAYGGTNFASLELMRNSKLVNFNYESLCHVGHTAEQMVQYTNQLVSTQEDIHCKKFIISGGVKNFLDAYYLMSLCNSESIYGMASGLLQYALVSYEELEQFFVSQMQGLLLAKSFLKIKSK
ncbi:MAG: isopentenyl-diphosphate delta-isomerase [Saprospiraceae bacterium]